MMDLLITKQKLQIINFLIKNMHIFKSHWLNMILTNEHLIEMMQNSIFYQTIIQILINDAKITQTNKNDATTFNYTHIDGGHSYYKYFWKGDTFVSYPNTFRVMIAQEKELPLPESLV